MASSIELVLSLFIGAVTYEGGAHSISKISVDRLVENVPCIQVRSFVSETPEKDKHETLPHQVLAVEYLIEARILVSPLL